MRQLRPGKHDRRFEFRRRPYDTILIKIHTAPQICASRYEAIRPNDCGPFDNSARLDPRGAVNGQFVDALVLGAETGNVLSEQRLDVADNIPRGLMHIGKARCLPRLNKRRYQACDVKHRSLLLCLLLPHRVVEPICPAGLYQLFGADHAEFTVGDVA